MKPNEPRKSHAGIVMVPPWVMTKHRELMAAISGEHAHVYVGMVALMGPDGYSLATTEECVEINPAIYGPMMVQGYNFLAGAGLGKLLTLMLTELRDPSHPIHLKAAELAKEDTEDDRTFEEKKLAALLFFARNAAESCIRQYLQVMFSTAGSELQKSGKPDVMLAGVSQMLGCWLTVARAAIKFEGKAEPHEGEL